MPTVVGSQAAPSDVEQLLVRSIEWTTFMDATFDTALEQANVILRYFLSEFMRSFSGDNNTDATA